MAAAKTMPNRTLYLSNLPDKLQKDDLKRSLYMLFSTYGPILDIVALKTMKMRGQAHVLFRDVHASAQALRQLDGMEVFGKPMKITYARSKSHTLSKLDGTFKQPTPTTTLSATNGTNAAPASSLQASVFAAPPGAQSASTAATLAAPPGLQGVASREGSVLGKRGRENEAEEEGSSAKRENGGDGVDGNGAAGVEGDGEEEEAEMDVDDDAMEESDSD